MNYLQKLEFNVLSALIELMLIHHREYIHVCLNKYAKISEIFF